MALTAKRPAAARGPAPTTREPRPERGAGSLGTREFLLVLAGGFLLAAAMFWPLPLHLSRDVAHSGGDPLIQAWQVAWGGHALQHQPLHFWDANLFFPNRDSLAFADSLAGFSPLGLIGEGVGAALVRYNLLFLFAYALALAGVYALARELGLSRPAALVAGVAFAFSPWRWEQSGKLHVLFSGTIPLCLALLVRGYRLRRPRAIVGGWLVAAWQVLIGVSLALILCYLLAVLGVFVVVRWLRAHRPRVERPVIAATAAGVAALLAATALVAPPYLRVQDAHPEARRSLEEVRILSPPLRKFISPPAENPVWGEAREFVGRDFWTGGTLFPGLATAALAAVGLATGAFSRRLRLGLAIAAAVVFVFSLGMTPADGRLSWRLLYDFAPGWSGVRSPDRLHTLTTLVLALLAGAGMQALAARAARLRLSGRRVAVAAATVAAALVLVEGSAWRFGEEGAGAVAGPAHPTIPRPPAGLEQAREPFVHIPPGWQGVFLYTVWSTEGFPRIVNGEGTFEPRNSDAIKDAMDGFPDERSVAAMRSAGVRTAVLHPALARGTRWEHAAARPLDGLPLVRRRVGEVVLFELR